MGAWKHLTKGLGGFDRLVAPLIAEHIGLAIVVEDFPVTTEKALGTGYCAARGAMVISGVRADRSCGVPC